MQKQVYFVSAYNPYRKQTIARVGLATEDSSHILKKLPRLFQVVQEPKAIPEDLAPLIHALLFAEGIPEVCQYFIYKKKTSPAPRHKVPRVPKSPQLQA